MPQVTAETLSYEDIQALFNVPTKELKCTTLFLEGDHWQEHDGWIGWRPETESRTAVRDWQLIEGGFTPKNVCRGMVKRYQGAVMGKQPDWDIVSAEKPETPEAVPSDAEEWKKVDASMSKWWTDKQAHERLKDFVWNKAAYGKSSLRIYIPSGYVKADPAGDVPTLDIQDTSDLDEILSKIHIDAPSYEAITDAIDPIFGNQYTALGQKVDPTKPASSNIKYELCYIGTDGKTYLRQVTQGEPGKSGSDQTVSVDLGGNLLTFVDGEYHDAMISRTVKAQQRQLNHANTMEGYSMANINFPPIYFTNAVTEVEEKVGNKKTKKIADLVSGAGRWINLVGLTIQTAAGDENLKDPNVIFQPQGKPEDFAKVATNKARDMHEEAGMLYVFLADNPYPSGDSRIEAMTDYLILLVDAKTLCDSLGTWLLQTVLRLAFNIAGTPEKNDKFNVLFSTNLTIGRLTKDDKSIMIQEVQAGLRSKRNYMIKTEVTDDPDAELRVIKADPPLPTANGPFGQNSGAPGTAAPKPASAAPTNGNGAGK